jgi:Xaa-Pro dipeptidase
MQITVDQLYPDHLKSVREAHDRALAATGYDAVAIFAGAEHGLFLDDQSYPFKPNPHFLWWVPVRDNPNCWVYYQAGSKPVLVYWQPVDYWYKPAEDPEGFWVDQFDVRMIATAEEAKKHVTGGGRVAFIGEPGQELSSWGFADMNPQGLINRLHFARAKKSEYEIGCIREANVIAARAHRAAEKAFRAGGSEYEIHMEYLRAAQHVDAQLPYGNIVALNENAAVLHYQHQSRERNGARSFLLDGGTTYNGYASDITRTYSREQDEFQALVDTVDRFQQQLVNAVKPGLDYREMQMMAHRYVGQTLAQFGFITTDADTAVATRITSAFFPHGIGHYLGLQVHDVAGFMADESGTTIPKPEGQPYLRLTRVVGENEVFTIEPGIYFIDSLLQELRGSDAGKHVNWKKVDEFRKFGGVRVEDDVVVRPGGSENLTRPAFAQLG